MRPHRLVIEAMGPFADEVVVELDDLTREGIFLIHGRTGAGKTSLLDAMCFALYGEVPGARARHALKSHHADPQATPRVRLEFSVHGQRYRVDRQPRYEVPRKRGEGTTTRHPKGALVRLEPGSGQELVLATSATEVTQEVIHLVGLTASQFQQVTLLPQGQFERVLRAGSDTREDLLKTLFDTVHFEQAGTWLEHEAKRRHLSVAEQRRVLAAVAEEAAHRRSDLGLGAAAVEADTTTPESDAAVAAALDAWEEEATAALADAERAVAEASEAVEHQERQLAELRAAADRWDRLHRAEAELSVLDEAEAAIATARGDLASATHAELLRTSLDDVADRAEALADAERELADALVAAERARARAPRLPACAAGLALAVPDPAALPSRLHVADDVASADAEELADARRALATERARLDELAEAAMRARTDRRHAEAARTQVEQATREAAEAQRQGEAARAELAALAAELAEATTGRDQLHGLAEAAEAAERQGDAAAELARLRTTIEEADHQLLDARAAALDAAEHHLELRGRYLDDIAATLATDLTDGSACLVCGSVEHPAPARPQVDAVSLEAVERAEEQATLADKRRQSIVDRLAELRQAAAGHTAAAGPHANDATAAAQVAAEAAAAHRDALVLADRLPTLTLRRTELEAIGLELAERQERAVVQAERATTQVESLDRHAAEAQARIDVAIGPGLVLDDVVAGLDGFDRALHGLERGARTTGQARLALTQAGERLAADLAASPFADESEARAALLDEPRRAALAHRVDEHQRRRALVEGTLAEPDLAGLPEDRPDTERAQGTLASCEARRDAALQRRTTVANAAGRIAELAAQHRAGRCELAELRADAELHEAVAARCTGRAAPKVSLQRWVLATYLDDICQHANRRLATMTGGRYQLLVARDAGRANTKTGLDLRVHDAHTGEERDVATLSGGETFQASLALALGVADGVEAHTGGVRLETLFVDEGFGTLDADTLQLAMDELDGLRAGGRTVGLISHVAALRERIRVGIEVTATTRGSSVQVGELSPV